MNNLDYEIKEKSSAIISAIQNLFHYDWDYTKMNLNFEMKGASFVKPCTVGKPDDWGNYEVFIESYAQLADLLGIKVVKPDFVITDEKSLTRRDLLGGSEFAMNLKKKIGDANKDFIPLIDDLGQFLHNEDSWKKFFKRLARQVWTKIATNDHQGLNKIHQLIEDCYNGCDWLSYTIKYGYIKELILASDGTPPAKWMHHLGPNCKEFCKEHLTALAPYEG